MRPSALRRSLSARLPARLSSSPVAPCPVRTAFDRWLGAELENLTCHGCYTSAAWMLRAMDVVVAAQKWTIGSIDGDGIRRRDRKTVDEHLEDVVELLDACNSLRDRMEAIGKYIESAAAAVHCLRGGDDPSEAALARAQAALGTCEAMERRAVETDKCSSSLRKMGENLGQGGGMRMGRSRHDPIMGATELDDALSGSKAMAMLVMGMLSVALSFRSKRGLPVAQGRRAGSWSSSLYELQKEVKEEIDKRKRGGGGVLDELIRAVVAAQKLRGLISRRRPENEMQWRDLRAVVGDLERNCGELEEGIKLFEGRVNELYRQLVSVRMALLGVISFA